MSVLPLELNCVEVEPGFSVGACRWVFCAPHSLFCLRDRVRLILIVGAFVSVLGLLLRAWAAGHIRKNSVLATIRPLRVHAQSAVPGKLSPGSWVYDWFGPMGLGILFAFCFLASIYR